MCIFVHACACPHTHTHTEFTVKKIFNICCLKPCSFEDVSNPIHFYSPFWKHLPVREFPPLTFTTYWWLSKIKFPMVSGPYVSLFWEKIHSSFLHENEDSHNKNDIEKFSSKVISTILTTDQWTHLHLGPASPRDHSTCTSLISSGWN